MNLQRTPMYLNIGIDIAMVMYIIYSYDSKPPLDSLVLRQQAFYSSLNPLSSDFCFCRMIVGSWFLEVCVIHLFLSIWNFLLICPFFPFLLTSLLIRVSNFLCMITSPPHLGWSYCAFNLLIYLDTFIRLKKWVFWDQLILDSFWWSE